MKMLQYLFCAGIMSFTAPSFATSDSWIGEHTYALYENGQLNIDYAGYNYDDVISVGGVGIELSMWADTKRDRNSDSPNYVENQLGKKTNDGEDAKLYGWWGEFGRAGFGLANSDEESNNSPQHSFDNIGNKNDSRTDFDFIMLSFTSEVSLTGASFSWLYNDDNQVSVAAINNNTISQLQSENKTWSQIASTVGMGSKGSFDISRLNYTSTFSSKFANEYSNYWLIGAYNSVFGSVDGASMYNDGFKLTAISFDKKPADTPPGEVSEPGTLALMFLGGGLVAVRRRRRAQMV